MLAGGSLLSTNSTVRVSWLAFRSLFYLITFVLGALFVVGAHYSLSNAREVGLVGQENGVIGIGWRAYAPAVLSLILIVLGIFVGRSQPRNNQVEANNNRQSGLGR